MKLKSTYLPAFAFAALASTLTPASADVVTDWNQITVAATKTGGLNSNLGTRIDAIASIAVYDAVNSILQFGTPYHYNVPPTGPADPAAAVAQAAHDVLTNYFPAQVTALDSNLNYTLSFIPNGPAKANGQAVGSAAAADIIALRAGDGSSPNTTYPGPGVITVGAYQLTPNIPTVTSPPFTFGPGINSQWANVTPFVLTSPSQFRPVPPPAVGSAKYTKALNEVKVLGNPANPRHTTEQTSIAQFYKQDAEILVNEAGRLLSAAHGLSLKDNALLFLRLNLALADSRIAEWDAKYFYLYWRPITALNADPDGVVRNNYTAWRPTILTPNHPSYPSGHSGTVVGIEVLRAYFGDANTLTLHTTTAGEPPRTVTSLTQIEIENGLSRVYGGIHFSFDNEAGQILGYNVAARVLTHGPQLLP
ncbi:MAG: vanadium-dependent haloperoxidase [Verrucomicrobiota bacterium]